MKLDLMHALSEPVIQIVKAALDEGLIVGLIHPIWSGPSSCAFATLSAYLECAKGCHPGHQLTIWSVAALDHQGVLLLRGYSNDLSSIRDWLHGGKEREFLALALVDTTPQAAYGDIDSFEDLLDLALRADPRGEFAVLPLSELLNGVYEPRLHLINAKRANERGEVPENKTEAAMMEVGRVE